MNNPNNKLIHESSPYLLQHANNPVNWYAWNTESLALAQKLNKPILLSIGYSACHWCHVMAHESFEDQTTANIMNEHFINIKVDREERPDLDKVYQTAHSLLTSRSGGWPLTVFLMPENQMPFYAGTYFPDKPRHNMPSFPEILQLVSDAYKNKQAEIQSQEKAIKDILKDISQHAPARSTLNTLPLDLARKQLGNAFDKIHGGFSDAPKFPHPDMLERSLRHYLFLKSQNKEDDSARNITLYSLDKMALGGFQDQVGGGFFRYSTDKYWVIPHFEKMLYDNAQLLALYAQAYCVNNKPLYKETIDATANWVIREMQIPQGGYCSALDADTEKTEGKFYVWRPEEIKAILSDEEFNIFEMKFNITEPSNFEGVWHLHSQLTNEALAKQSKHDLKTIKHLLSSAQKKLLIKRNQRTQPERDEKILCAWNGLMIRAMALAGRRTQRPEYIASATLAINFIKKTLWKNQNLLAAYKDNNANLNAYLDDYAYLLQAIIELLQCNWSNTYYHWAQEIADSLIKNFEDPEQGGFFFTRHDHETLIYRSKTFSDDAMPSGNAVAANALLQLGLLSGNTKYLASAEKTIRCAYNELNEQAITHCSLLHALELLLKPGVVIVLRGTESDMQLWQNIANSKFIAHLTCVAINKDLTPPDSLKDKTPNGNICAYICEGSTCLPVITDKIEFETYIKGLVQHE